MDRRHQLERLYADHAPAVLAYARRRIDPATGGDGPRPRRQLFYAIGPDGVSDFSVTVRGGITHRADFVDNVAAVAFDGHVEPERWSWTLPEGRRAVQEPGGRFHVERP